VRLAGILQGEFLGVFIWRDGLGIEIDEREREY